MTQSASPLPFIRLEGINKRFGELVANEDLNFEINAGKITALVGENGAGKSTAMNILTGLYLPDAGSVFMDGEAIELGSPRAAIAAGIGMVHQQFKLAESLTGFENVSLATHHGRFRQPRRADAEITSLAHELGFEIDLDARVWQLPLAARQQLELLRILTVGARALILDEPTSVLSPLETEKLFDIIRRIRQSGQAVVLISHKLEEVVSIADDIVVMRAGRAVRQGPIGEIDLETLSALIVGERVFASTSRPCAQLGPTVLSVSGICVEDDRGTCSVDDVSFDLREGELVAVLGVAGNGQTELMDAIGGLRAMKSGTIEAPRRAGWRNFGFVPSQHLGTAISPGLTIADNTLIGHQHHPPFGMFIDPAAKSRWAEQIKDRFSTTGHAGDPAATLSGGNLQRLMLGRELAHEAPLILASYPARGLDIASAAAIRRAFVDAANAGKAVLIASEEIDETLQIATRVLVMHRGRIVADTVPGELDSRKLGALMTLGRAA